MRDDLMGGLLATAIAAPVLIICCAGGGALLAAVFGAVGGWLSGINAIASLITAAGATLAWRTLRRRKIFGACCLSPAESEVQRNG